MNKYKEVLDLVAETEINLTIINCVVSLLIITALWVSYYFHCKKMKAKYPKKYNLEKQIKIRRQGIYAATAISCICIAFIVLFCVGTVSTVADIKKDIKGNTYVTYSGRYYINYWTYKSAPIYERKVSLENEMVYLPLNAFSESISTEAGEHKGTLIYGQHSKYVVDIKK